MGREPPKRHWRNVSELHPPGSTCDGRVRTFVRRRNPPDSEFHERCIGFAWCALCREYVGTMVYVSRREVLDDPFADLDPEERRLLYASEQRLISRLDQLPERPPQRTRRGRR
ncbi:hypothetical protein [Actinocatenispora rupis]|uniref:Uncharacterized protein n=1 Tax=Actinocatenispora rupis TaxID=519421 RepID=A0A8J3NAQ9_9ACTN|nr:hypothetical protein [Actinocatenispora rupis]GID09950.1 hypothetical protein Aru02nite_08390 [Actinocatenispora rupis]